MGTEAELALAAGFFGGMFVTAVVLWFHERRTRQVLEDASRRLRRNEAQTHALLRESRDVLAVVDRDGTLRYVSPAADRILGRSSAQFSGTTLAALIHPEDRPRVVTALEAPAAPGGKTQRLEFRVQHRDGHWVLLEAAIEDLRHDPAVDGIVMTCRDVSERQRADTDLCEAQERFRATFEHAPIGMALIGLDGRFGQVNRVLARMLGRAEDQLAGAPALAVIHPGDQEAAHATMRGLIAGEVPNTRIKHRYVHADGRPVWVDVTMSLIRDAHLTPRHLVAQVEDIAERRASGAQLAHQAVHDPLTGLPNRQHFVELLSQALVATHGAEHVAVLFLGLDRFQVVNDSLGHSAGDRLLVAVGDRLRSATRPNDVVARFGSDQFTILCFGVTNESTAFEFANRVAATVAKPVVLVEGEVFVTASVGIAMSTGDLDTPETIIRNADTAMHRAKEQGRARSETYDEHAHDRAVRHLRTGNDLHRALERQELRMHYQPIISLETGRISASRPCCAGSTPSGAWWDPTSSSPSRKRPASWRRSGSGHSSRPVIRLRPGTPTALD
jgi:diguanylate cyclase (GGDEF)-like protein/PAS domain S-box-containing protein